MASLNKISFGLRQFEPISSEFLKMAPPREVDGGALTTMAAERRRMKILRKMMKENDGNSWNEPPASDRMSSFFYSFIGALFSPNHF